jgi:hypothetical protein
MITVNKDSRMAGSRVWAIPGGHIPLRSTGEEPERTSRDELIILNINSSAAHVVVHIYYADRPPAGPYEISVEAERVRRIRCNDLINPEIIPLATDYAIFIECDIPVIVQFLQIDTSEEGRKVNTLMAFPVTSP